MEHALRRERVKSWEWSKAMRDIWQDEILKVREMRWQRRRSLAADWPALLSATLCIPLPARGEPCFSAWFHQQCQVLMRYLSQAGFEPFCLEISDTADGPIMLTGCRCAAAALKRLCVKLEETLPGGRLLDLDVMGQDLHAWSRSDLGLSPRRCFICGKHAAVCVVTRAHAHEVLISYAHEQLKLAQQR